MIFLKAICICQEYFTCVQIFLKQLKILLQRLIYYCCIALSFNNYFRVFVLIGLVIFYFLLIKNYIISFLSLFLFSILLSYLNTQKILSLGKERVKLAQIRLKNILEGLSGAKIFTLTGSNDKIIMILK